jgi:hypothetical protein
VSSGDKRTKSWAIVALVGGVLFALNSISSLQPRTSAGAVVGGAVDLLLGSAIAVAAAAVARRGAVGQVALLGLLGAAAFGWHSLALAPIETLLLGGRPTLFDLSTAVSALAVLVGSVGVSLSARTYRGATWEIDVGAGGKLWLALVAGAAVTSVIALFLPYVTYQGNAEAPTDRVDAWTYFTGLNDTVTLVLALSCGTLAALSLLRPHLPYRWPLACAGLATLGYVFTPSTFGSTSQTGQAVSVDVGFWLLLVGAVVISVGAVNSWRSLVSRGGTRAP